MDIRYNKINVGRQCFLGWQSTMSPRKECDIYVMLLVHLCVRTRSLWAPYLVQISFLMNFMFISSTMLRHLKYSLVHIVFISLQFGEPYIRGHMTNKTHTVYSFEFTQSYFRPIRIWDWFARLESILFPFCYIILTTEFNWPSFKFSLEPEGEKGQKHSGSIPRNACVACET